MEIIDAREEDLPAILEIYNDVIASTTAVFSETPVTLENRRSWLARQYEQGWPVLVAVEAGAVQGFAAFGPFRDWPCYRNTVEHSVHVRALCRGRGIGPRLIEALIPIAGSLGKHVMIAGIEATNTASLAIHARLGFEEVGRLREVGWKFGRFLDLVLMQRSIEPNAEEQLPTQPSTEQAAIRQPGWASLTQGAKRSPRPGAASLPAPS